VVDDPYSITPKQALGLIAAAGVEDAAKLIRDYAAAGLVRSYALLQITIDAKGRRHEVRGGRVPPYTWERIIAADVDQDIWSGGTARLSGSDLIGGDPAIHVTAVAFHSDDIMRLADHQHLKPPAKRAVSPVSPTPGIDADAAPTPKPIKKQQAPDLNALHSGALLLTVNQAMAALAIGRTKVYELINEGTLERPDGGTRVTAGSVRKYAGLSD
jgi:hypothetical protein